MNNRLGLSVVATLIALLPPLSCGRREPVPVQLESSRYDPPDSIVSSLSRSIRTRLDHHLDLLESMAAEDLDRAPRFVDAATGEKRQGDTNVRFALHGVMRFLISGHWVEGHKHHLDRAMNLVRRWVNQRDGMPPAFDVGCVGPYFLYGYRRNGASPDERAIQHGMDALLKLRVADGGWINLDYTHETKAGAAPPDSSSNEVNPSAILALLAAGLTLDHADVARALKANDKAILSGAFKKEYPPDYQVGNAQTLLLWKRIGFSDPKAYARARGELINFAGAQPKDGELYPLAMALLGLQGVIPEDSKSYRTAMTSLMRAYDPGEGIFVESHSSIFGTEFTRTMSFLLSPYLVLLRAGYEGRLYDLPLPESLTGSCPTAVPSGVGVFWKWKRIHINTGTSFYLERAAAPDYALDLSLYEPSPGGVPVWLPDASIFRLHTACKGRYVPGPWYR